MKTTSRLEKFLINRGLLKKFKNNLGKRHSYKETIAQVIHTDCGLDYITSAFSWRDSPEGVHFWSEVHYEWELSLDENTL